MNTHEAFAQIQVQTNSCTCFICTLRLWIFYQREAVHTAETTSESDHLKSSAHDSRNHSLNHSLNHFS